MEQITTSGSALLIAKVNKKANFLIHNVTNLQLIKVKIEGNWSNLISSFF